MESTSRLVRIAVSGVRSSWEATAAKSLADSSAALVRCCSSPMRASIPSTASAISTASWTPRTFTSSGLDCALITRACSASTRNGLIMISHSTEATTTVRDDDPATDQQHPSVQFVDPPLRFGQRSADGDRRLTGGEGADPVLDTVDRRAGVTVVELRQDDVLAAPRR